MLFIKGLAKKYGSVLAIEALDLEIPRGGTVFSFIGRNGAEKNHYSVTWFIF